MFLNESEILAIGLMESTLRGLICLAFFWANITLVIIIASIIMTIIPPKINPLLEVRLLLSLGLILLENCLKGLEADGCCVKGPGCAGVLGYGDA